jgi:hypothetical protein
VTATRQAEVVAAHLHPLEIRWRGQHPAQQLVVGGLDQGPLAQSRSRFGNPLGQIVAQPLQLAKVEDPWLGGDGTNAVLDLHPAEGLGEKAGELALEMADLAPQLDPGEALVDLDMEPVQAVSCEQIWHRPGFECRSRPGCGKPENS